MSKKTILIVEDDAVIARIYQTTLQKADFAVELATDGASGFNRIKEIAPDGVLLDLMMPGLNGIELLKRLRQTPPFEKLPVVVYTNAFIPQLVQEAKRAGATEVFDKSTLTPSMLVDAFKSATESDPSQGESK